MSLSQKKVYVALYDVSPEHAHFESPFVTNRARTLARALAKAGIGLVSRIGSPVTLHVFTTLESLSVPSVALSPAASLEEHTQAFRLPTTDFPTVFTGRGAIGADKMALASASALIVFGSQAHLFEGVIEYAKGHSLPIAVLTDETPESIHARVVQLSPSAAAGLFVSHDPDLLVQQLSGEIRRRHFGSLV